MRRIRVVVTAMAVFSLGFPFALRAQDGGQKKALLKELFEVSNTRKLTEDMVFLMLDQVKQQQQMILEQALQNKPELRQNQEEMRKKFEEIQTYTSSRFKELLRQQMDFDRVVDDVYAPLYDKYFSEQDIKALIDFYKSETGSKFLRLTPLLAQESAIESNKIFTPILLNIMQTVTGELAQKFPELKQ